MIRRLIANQLVHPSGLIGRFILPALWNRRNAALNEQALHRLQLDSADRILEVGFGGGYLLGRILTRVTQGHVSGVDRSTAIVGFSRRRFASSLAAGIIDLHCAGVDALPYPAGSFHKAVSVNSLFYWPDFRRGLREIHRVLMTGGLLVLVFTGQPDLDKRGLNPFGIRSFRDDEVGLVLGDAGFADIRVEHDTDRYRAFTLVTART